MSYVLYRYAVVCVSCIYFVLLLKFFGFVSKCAKGNIKILYLHIKIKWNANLNKLFHVYFSLC